MVSVRDPGSKTAPASRLLAAFAVVVVALGSHPALAARSVVGIPAVGEAVLVVPAVRASLGDVTEEISINDDVFADEVIQTSADGATRILLRDGTELTVGASSRVVLDRFVYDPEKGTGELVANFITGTFNFKSGTLPKDTYKLNTPMATLAIRGTEIIIVAQTGQPPGVTPGENGPQPEPGQGQGQGQGQGVDGLPSPVPDAGRGACVVTYFVVEGAVVARARTTDGEVGEWPVATGEGQQLTGECTPGEVGVDSGVVTSFTGCSGAGCSQGVFADPREIFATNVTAIILAAAEPGAGPPGAGPTFFTPPGFFDPPGLRGPPDAVPPFDFERPPASPN